MNSFEDRLALAFDAWASEADLDVDAATIASLVTVGHRREWLRIPTITRSPWLAPLAATLLLLAAFGAIAAAALLLREPHRFEGIYVPVPDMSVARNQPILVPMDDGSILIAGGERSVPSDPVALEVLNPESGIYTPIAGDVPVGTGEGLQLPDGRVIVVAYAINGSTLGYMIDPAARTSRIVFEGRQVEIKMGLPPGMALLDDGRVLLSGGLQAVVPALIFDPVSETLEATGSMRVPRMSHAMITLQDGRVLVAGGRSATAPASPHYGEDGLRDDAEIYDPTTGSWSMIESRMTRLRGDAWATLMANGKVLVMQVGGTDTVLGEVPTRAVVAEVFDPATETFTGIEPLNWPGQANMTALVDGRVLATGSAPAPQGSPLSGTGRIPWAGIFDPIANTLTSYPAPGAIYPVGVALDDVRVLLAGGYAIESFNSPLPAVEIFE